uniref:Uncharacterized protein n=1 Tax=uncultured marine virus TaxID=186617 RepID=A0A0F7L8P0_9VIRU|nr:hypothetical protein [uncultured marine virus]
MVAQVVFFNNTRLVFFGSTGPLRVSFDEITQNGEWKNIYLSPKNRVKAKPWGECFPESCGQEKLFDGRWLYIAERNKNRILEIGLDAWMKQQTLLICDTHGYLD